MLSLILLLLPPVCFVGSATPATPHAAPPSQSLVPWCDDTDVHPDVARLFHIILLAAGRSKWTNKCTVTAAEFLQYLRAVGGADEDVRPGPHVSSASIAHASAVLDLLDADNDGQLSVHELAAVARGSTSRDVYGPHDPQQVHIAMTDKVREIQPHAHAIYPPRIFPLLPAFH